MHIGAFVPNMQLTVTHPAHLYHGRTFSLFFAYLFSVPLTAEPAPRFPAPSYSFVRLYGYGAVLTKDCWAASPCSHLDANSASMTDRCF